MRSAQVLCNEAENVVNQEFRARSLCKTATFPNHTFALYSWGGALPTSDSLFVTRAQMQSAQVALHFWKAECVVTVFCRAHCLCRKTSTLTYQHHRACGMHTQTNRNMHAYFFLQPARMLLWTGWPHDQEAACILPKLQSV